MADRFYVNCPLAPGPVTLQGPEAHHLATVCRLRPGDAVCLFNGDGHEYPAEVTAVAQRQIHERHMLAGVTIINPAATVIDADVHLAQDTVIAPFTSLHGATRVGTGSTIGPHATLVDARVGEVPQDRDVYVICKVGGRSEQAVRYLNQQGRTTVNVAGGMMAWAAAGRPMVSEAGGRPFVA